MSSPISPRNERILQLGLDYAERLLLIILFAGFAIRIFGSLGANPFNLLALISDGFVVFFLLIRRSAGAVSSRPLDWIVAMLGTMLPLLARPGGEPLASALVTALIMLFGLTVSFWAKLSLQRSFGIAAANRGVVSTGPYRIVRHPMYAGYVVVHVGFLLANPLLWNLALYVAAFVCQIVRIIAEERILAQDPAYADLMTKVRRRLIPGVF